MRRRISRFIRLQSAVFSRDKVRPIFAGALKEDVLSLIRPHVENYALTYQAAVHCDEEPLIQAFHTDPNVMGHHPSDEKIRKLVEDMIKNTISYLPEGWKK